jgi:transcriptional regulator GlxA family with amidase domain
VWTTSGVSAGTDGVIAWISKVYGEDLARRVVQWMEYIRNPDPHNDPFAALYNCQDVPPVKP